MAPKRRDLTKDPKALGARVRSEISRFLRFLGMRDYVAALEVLRPGRNLDDEPWTAELLERAMGPYFKEYKQVRTDNAARAPMHTKMREGGEHRWSIRQTLVDPQDDNFWFADFEVDLPHGGDPAEPIVALVDVGA